MSLAYVKVTLKKTLMKLVFISTAVMFWRSLFTACHFILFIREHKRYCLGLIIQTVSGIEQVLVLFCPLL